MARRKRPDTPEATAIEVDVFQRVSRHMLIRCIGDAWRPEEAKMFLLSHSTEEADGGEALVQGIDAMKLIHDALSTFISLMESKREH
jgi:hypothetical protein